MFINKNGLANDLKYTRANDFKNGFAHVKNRQGESFIDTSGKFICRPFKSMLYRYLEDSVILSGNSYYSMDGFLLHRNFYSLAQPYYRGYAFVAKNRKYSVINKLGLPVTEEKFDEIGKMSEEKVKVGLKNFYGIADLSGKIIVPPDYDKIKPVGKKVVRVERGNYLGYLYLNGQWLYEPAK